MMTWTPKSKHTSADEFILGLRHHQLRWTGEPNPHTARPPKHASEPTRARGCKVACPTPLDTEHALTRPSLSACAPACVRLASGARAPRVSHRKPIRPTNASPAARPSPTETRENEEKHSMRMYVRCFPRSGGSRACARKKRALDRRLARHVCLPPR